MITENTTFTQIKKLYKYEKPLKKTLHFFKSTYYYDRNGTVYTNNPKTYFTKFGFVLRKSEGKDKVVTLRDIEGKKVSISRAKLAKLFNGGK